MAQNVQVCDISEKVVEKLKKFRFRKEKNTAALILKVDTSAMQIVMEEDMEDITIEELQAEISEHQPRYIVLSYVLNHSDGRVSYPLCFIYSCPGGGKPELSMMYAGSRNRVQQQLGLTKVFEIRNTEDLTEEWLKEKLAFFR